MYSKHPANIIRASSLRQAGAGRNPGWMGAAGLGPVQGLQSGFSLWEVPRPLSGWSQGVGKSPNNHPCCSTPPHTPIQEGMTISSFPSLPQSPASPLRRRPPLGWRGPVLCPRLSRVRSWRPRLRLWAKGGGGGSQRPSGKLGGAGESPRTSRLCFPAAGWSPTMVALGVELGGVTALGQPARGSRLRSHPCPVPQYILGPQANQLPWGLSVLPTEGRCPPLL